MTEGEDAHGCTPYASGKSTGYCYSLRYTLSGTAFWACGVASRHTSRTLVSIRRTFVNCFCTFQLTNKPTSKASHSPPAHRRQFPSNRVVCLDLLHRLSERLRQAAVGAHMLLRNLHTGRSTVCRRVCRWRVRVRACVRVCVCVCVCVCA